MVKIALFVRRKILRECRDVSKEGARGHSWSRRGASHNKGWSVIHLVSLKQEKVLFSGRNDHRVNYPTVTSTRPGPDPMGSGCMEFLLLLFTTG